MMLSRSVIYLALSGALFTGGAAAHGIWFEPNPDSTLSLYYGEYDKNMHEVTPGGMDRFGALQASLENGSRSQPLKMALAHERFHTGVKPGVSDTLVAEDRQYPLFTLTDEGKKYQAYWIPSTRWVGHIDKPYRATLDLDIVPTGEVVDGKYGFQLLLRGKPLAKVPLAMLASSGWERSEQTDKDGKAFFSLPWQDLYVMEVEYRDRAAGGGERTAANGSKEAYGLRYYTTTLSFSHQSGVTQVARAEKNLPASEKARLAGKQQKWD